MLGWLFLRYVSVIEVSFSIRKSDHPYFDLWSLHSCFLSVVDLAFCFWAIQEGRFPHVYCCISRRRDYFYSISVRSVGLHFSSFLDIHKRFASTALMWGYGPDASGTGCCPLESSCKHVTELVLFHKGRESVDQTSDPKLGKKGSASWSYVIETTTRDSRNKILLLSCFLTKMLHAFYLVLLNWSDHITSSAIMARTWSLFKRLKLKVV
jgi:hypothetical protein